MTDRDEGADPLCPEGLPPADRLAWPDWADRFFEELRVSHRARRAAEAVSITPQAAYLWRNKSESFAAAWDEALEGEEAKIVRLARERANGWFEPVYHNGEVVDHKWVYDRRAQAILLKHALSEAGGGRKGRVASAAEIVEAMARLRAQMRASVPPPPDGGPPQSTPAEPEGRAA